MPVYFLVGPAAAIIGVVAVFFVMRNRSTQKKSMYSSRRGQIERKVQAARARTLAPRGRGQKQSTRTEIAAMPAPPAVTDAPGAPARQAWEAPAAPPPPAYTPPPAAEAYAPPEEAYAPPAAPAFEPAPAPAFEPAPASAAQEPVAQPEWATPAPSEEIWTPAPAAPADFSTAAPAPAAPVMARAEPVSTPAGAGASWEVVGAEATAGAPAAAAKGGKESAQPTGAAWSLSSGAAPSETDEGDEDVVHKPSAAMALAQYAVLVVGLVMVLIGVLVMVANAKVT